jgi:hypothetical protein
MTSVILRQVSVIVMIRYLAKNVMSASQIFGDFLRVSHVIVTVLQIVAIKHRVFVLTAEIILRDLIVKSNF